MEASLTLPVLSHLSPFSPKQLKRRNGAFNSFLPMKQRTFHPSPIHCNNPLITPGLGEILPEVKAAKDLHNFFTFVAAKLATFELEHEAFMELLEYLSRNWDGEDKFCPHMMEFLSRNYLGDGDKFCADLMRKSPRLKSYAMRVLEVRSEYSKNEFDWDFLKKLLSMVADDSNKRIMREYVLETTRVESDE